MHKYIEPDFDILTRRTKADLSNVFLFIYPSMGPCVIAVLEGKHVLLTGYQARFALQVAEIPLLTWSQVHLPTFSFIYGYSRSNCGLDKHYVTNLLGLDDLGAFSADGSYDKLARDNDCTNSYVMYLPKVPNEGASWVVSDSERSDAIKAAMINGQPKPAPGKAVYGRHADEILRESLSLYYYKKQREMDIYVENFVNVLVAQFYPEKYPLDMFEDQSDKLLTKAILFTKLDTDI